MKVVVNVAQVFIGTGPNARRYKRGDIVEVEGKQYPKWSMSVPEAMKKASAKKPEPEEPKTLSEMTAKATSGKTKAFGQEV